MYNKMIKHLYNARYYWEVFVQSVSMSILSIDIFAMEEFSCISISIRMQFHLKFITRDMYAIIFAEDVKECDASPVAASAAFVSSRQL